ncbi:MAG: prephenate dehydrogenase/arogenate dehydrogenase family protein [Candidatus Abyssubacteria bacterium]
MNVFFDKVAIIGVGLLGGSIGLALKARRMCGTVVGMGRRHASLKAALDAGAIDEALPDFSAAGADLVVVCTPVGSVAGLVAEIECTLDDGCVVTDVGSTKGGIVYEIERMRRAGRRFVGSHPLAGSEKKGVQHASADLFEGATVFMTPTPATDRTVAARVREMWEALGGAVLEMEPEAHDRIVAKTSHLPHVVAALLVAGLRTLENDVTRFVGKGFLDTTRIASSDPEMWADICMNNMAEIREAMAMLREDLEEFDLFLSEGGYEKVLEFLKSTKSVRDSLNQRKSDD